MKSNKKDLRINHREAPEVKYFNTDTIYTANFSTTVKRLIRAEIRGETLRIPIPDDIRLAAANRVDYPSNFSITLSKEDRDIIEFIEDLSRGELKQLIIRLLNQAFGENKKKTDRKEYDIYLVDSNIPYNLDEDFEHTSPAAFLFNDVDVCFKNWKDFFPLVCEHIISYDRKGMETIIEEGMKGKGNNYYLCRSSDNQKMKKLPNINGYATNVLGARQATELTIKLLDAVGLSHDSIKLFLQSDRRQRNRRGYEENGKR